MSAYRYVIGNRWPRATIHGSRVDGFDRKVYDVSFWHDGRAERLECFGEQLSPNPDRASSDAAERERLARLDHEDRVRMADWAEVGGL